MAVLLKATDAGTSKALGTAECDVPPAGLCRPLPLRLTHHGRGGRGSNGCLPAQPWREGRTEAAAHPGALNQWALLEPRPAWRIKRLFAQKATAIPPACGANRCKASHLVAPKLAGTTETRIEYAL